MEYKFSELRVGDLVFTASKTFIGSAIRFFTWGKSQAFNINFPNHVGILIEINGYIFIAEMLENGLEINSLHAYDGTKKQSICAIYRNESLSGNERQTIQQKIIKYLHKQLKYDFKGLLEFLHLGKDSDSRMYCSELASHLYSSYLPFRDKWSPKDLMIECSSGDIWRKIENFTEGEK